MGNDTSVISAFRNGKAEREEHAEEYVVEDDEKEESMQASTSSKVVEHNRKDVETHHGLILQRFDSADWMMMKNKLGGKTNVSKASGARSGESSPPSKLSKETDYNAMKRTPKLRPSAPNDAIGSPCRSSPLGK